MMSSDPNADDEAENNFAPTVVTTEAEIAESLRLPYAREAGKVMEVLEETESVVIKLSSSWWGNETFGVWSEWFFVHPNGTSEKALFVDKGTALNDPVDHLRRAESRSESNNGWTSKAVRRARRKALQNWGDDYGVGPGRGPGHDDRDVFTDGSCPLSVVDVAFRLPEPENDLVFPVEGEPRRGKLSNGDIYITETKRTRYGTKAVLKGDTYNALSQDGDNACEAVWDDTHASFDGDDWTCDPDGESLLTAIKALNAHGYSVALDESFDSRLQEAKGVAESFGVEL